MIFSEFCHKKDVLISLSPSDFKVIFALLGKIEVFHIQVAIIEVKILALEKHIQSIL